MSFVEEPVVRLENLSFWYSGEPALRDVNLEIPRHAITVVFGPAGSGKTTLLRIINRLTDLAPDGRIAGRALLNGQDIHDPSVDVVDLRRRVGMVFALPLPLPGTIRYNVTYGPKLAGVRNRATLDEIVERSLTQAALWDEVKDRLDDPATALSGGQQQRLCIARSLALTPEVLLLDEPTSGLDPISTSRVEESLYLLREEYSIVIVPHSVQQASRVADYAAFLLSGELVEAGPGEAMFSNPQDQRTEDYIVGRFG
jgi:phosphate transport system ATP-binding protein